MARIFSYDGREFPDPDARLTIDEVRQQLSQFFPELVNADTRETRRGEDTLYTFSKRIGTKGQGQSVVTVLRGVPATHLRVFELAADLLDANGALDLDAAGERQPDINLALAEADAYTRATRQAVQALQRLLD